MSEPAAAQDRADMERLARGDPGALDELMARHAGPLFGCLQRLLQNAADAEDLAQETFVRVYEHRDRFDPTHAFHAWLYAIAMNLVRDRFRWRSRHPETPLETPASASTDAPPPPASRLTDPARTPRDTAVGNEQAEAVRQAVARLPEDLRLPLVLAEFEERSHAEISAILGCSPKAVEMRVYRARQQLRRDLARWLDDPGPK